MNGTAWNTNPEHIAAMQAFVAYAGAKGQAQMDGAISCIGTISNGDGTSQLSSIESQFSGTAMSVQLMTTGDQIRDAETQLRADCKDFMTTAKSSIRDKQYRKSLRGERQRLGHGTVRNAPDP